MKKNKTIYIISYNQPTNYSQEKQKLYLTSKYINVKTIIAIIKYGRLDNERITYTISKMDDLRKMLRFRNIKLKKACIMSVRLQEKHKEFVGKGYAKFLLLGDICADFMLEFDESTPYSSCTTNFPVCGLCVQTGKFTLKWTLSNSR